MHIEQLGPYRIGKKLGRGGMGSVYEAWDNSSGARVAVKTLSPHLAMAEGFRERFESEIDSLKQLQHAGIVRLYGYGEQDGVLFYSMEVVDGTSLEEEIAAGRRFDWQETLDLGIQVCRALKHAHDHGVVHRDIKPANLLLDHADRVKIADFGIARLFGGTQLTTAGGVLGTADYMSPEQADGRVVTDQCDQYSLGGVLYALLTGQPPFRAKTLPEMLQLQRFAKPVPVRQYAPDTPEQVERLILQLLAKEPEHRFPNVMVLARHMEAMTKALSRSVTEQTGDSHNREPPSKTEVTGAPNRIQEDRASEDKLHEATLDREENPLMLDTEDKVSSRLFDAATVADPSIFEREEAQAGEGSLISSRSQESSAGGHRFTTIDQEEARRKNQQPGNLLPLLMQLLAILAALGLLLGGGWWLMRPATSDSLYAQIMEVIEEKGTNNLRIVDKPLQEFNERFARDYRNAELDKYREELKMQKMERMLKRKVKFGGASHVSPVGQLYAIAVSMAMTDPQRGMEMLSSLLALYDPQNLVGSGELFLSEGIVESNESVNTNVEEGLLSISEEDRHWLVIASRQLAKLSESDHEQQVQLLDSLNERLRTAVDLHSSHPRLAIPMFQAIVNLYSGQAWASEIVDQARQYLDKKGIP
ncbi:MAG: serine/threonine-protein kinase [Pirellulales bacterium]